MNPVSESDPGLLIKQKDHPSTAQKENHYARDDHTTHAAAWDLAQAECHTSSGG